MEPIQPGGCSHDLAEAAAQADEPLVSVIVPAWNAEVTLAETLRSVAAQTHRNLEIIIVDDASTDSTAEVAEAFCAGDPRARLIRSPVNRGLAPTRNIGLRSARGEWVAPIDADDLWHPLNIERQLAAALGAPALPGLVFAWHRLVDKEGFVTGSGERWTLDGCSLCRLAYCNAVGNGSSALFLRPAMLECGGYDETLSEACEDYMLELQIARRYPVASVPQHLAGWRQHERNMSADLERMDRAIGAVCERMVAASFPVPAKVVRWTAGKSALTLAERRFWQGNLAGSLTKLAEAARLDGERFLVQLAYRAVRSVARRIRTEPGCQARVRFFDLDPAAPGPANDPHAPVFMTRLLDSFEDKRVRRLAGLENSRSCGPAPLREGLSAPSQ